MVGGDGALGVSGLRGAALEQVGVLDLEREVGFARVVGDELLALEPGVEVLAHGLQLEQQVLVLVLFGRELRLARLEAVPELLELVGHVGVAFSKRLTFLEVVGRLHVALQLAVQLPGLQLLVVLHEPDLVLQRVDLQVLLLELDELLLFGWISYPWRPA